MRTSGLTGRPWLDELLRGAAFAVLGLLLWWAAPEVAVKWRPDTTDLPPVGTAATIVAAAAGVVLRRRHPMLGLAVTVGALAVGILGTGHTPLGVLLCFCDALYHAVRLGSPRASWTVAGLAAAVAGVTSLVSLVNAGGRAALVTFLNLVLLLAVPVFWALEVRRHAETAEAERERAEQARRLAELDRAAAVGAERARMARDLHDVIAGKLSAIAIQSEAVLSVPDPDPPILRKVLTSVREESVAALTEMRAMIGLLRADGSGDADPRTAPAGLDRLDDLLATARSTGLTVTVEDRRDGGELPAAVDLAAYRIVQEALTNAAKHAPGSAVSVTLARTEGGLVVEVANPLVADAPPGGGTGTGLLGLRERAAAVGGTVEAGPEGDRWRLRAELPVATKVGSRS
ncbi:Signal transduction histidine kinase [Pseudonocardia thermophila]|uniref:histidine kinase n=1 Tax=Pseudonocardia thermophila TaxID=1848 RepID=A0A1M6RPP0_PSETH|nr:histidine kinase [Pseudonocardia thermophila]SHK34481.1 Signal transduction histidine kinase [Pseudonocardia thermophila]